MSFLKDARLCWNRFRETVLGKSSHKKETFKKTLRAFSLIELIISLIAISVIMAAFAPQISKKLSGNGLTIGGISLGACEDPEVAAHCSICDSSGACILCRLETDGGCPEGEGVQSSKCKCVPCSEAVEGSHNAECLSCKIQRTGLGTCNRCSLGFYVSSDHKCQPCPGGRYCPDGSKSIHTCPAGHKCPELSTSPSQCGVNTHARRGSDRCTACAADEYAPAGAENCTRCSSTYGDGCTRCNTSICTEVDASSGQYYLKDGRAHRCSSISGCDTCNSSGCTKAKSGYYLKDSTSAPPCSAMPNCNTCHITGGCISCNSGHYLANSTTCLNCNTMNQCRSCSQYGAVCTECNSGHYLNSSNNCQPCGHIQGCGTCSHTSKSCTRCANNHFMVSNLHCPACSSLTHCTSCHHDLTNPGCTFCPAPHGSAIYNHTPVYSGGVRKCSAYTFHSYTGAYTNFLHYSTYGRSYAVSSCYSSGYSSSYTHYRGYSAANTYSSFYSKQYCTIYSSYQQGPHATWRTHYMSNASCAGWGAWAASSQRANSYQITGRYVSQCVGSYSAYTGTAWRMDSTRITFCNRYRTTTGYNGPWSQGSIAYSLSYRAHDGFRDSGPHYSVSTNYGVNNMYNVTYSFYHHCNYTLSYNHFVYAHYNTTYANYNHYSRSVAN